MHLRDRIIIKIENIAFGGEGVGRIDNFVVFVPFAAEGDELEIELTKIKKNYARGKIINIINASPLRAKPLCKYYENCGGCCYQHISYQRQLEIKKKQVEEAFQKIGKIAAPPVFQTVPSSEIYHYRGKAHCHLLKTSQGNRFGFVDISGGKIVDVERCEIMEETINTKIGKLRNNPMGLSNKVTRLTIWSDLPHEGENKKGQIVRIVKDREFLVPQNGFFQNNLFITDALVDEVCRLALSGQLNTVVDAYCGCGLFSIFLARFAGMVLGIELNSAAVKLARLNAERENIKNVTFIGGDVAEKLSAKKLLPEKKKLDLLILDPPRLGLSKSVLQAVASVQASRLIYISCNPATQSRDVRYLNEIGYKLLSLQPFDMFPQTAHVETVGLLVRRESSNKTS